MSFTLASNIGHFASEWINVPAKKLLWEIDNRSADGKGELLSLSGQHGVLKKSEVSQKTSEAASLENYKIVCEGDLISNKMQAWNGVFGISPYEGITSPDYAVYRFKGNCYPKFIEYLFRTKLYSLDFLTRSNGIGTGFMRLNPRSLLETKLWLPKISLQQRIAAYLDRETGRIDGLIGEKGRFVGLLREKRVAAISHAVTKGLDPNAPLKPSGQDWLGDIPAHWEVVPANWLFQPSKERANEGDQVLSATQKYDVIPLADFERLEGRQVTLATKNLDMRKRVVNGGVKRGQRAA